MPIPTQQRPNASIIRGLQYFEAVARHRSVRVAAAELGVSQSAVSHQIRELTRVLGEQLLERSGRGIAVTPAGERLAERLSATFSSLQSSLDDIVGSGTQLLRVAVCSSFGPSWLIPRLNGFIKSNPGIGVELRLYARDPHLSNEVADVMVTALPVAPGFTSLHIMDEMLVSVQAPAMPKGRRRLITTELEPQLLGVDWTSYCEHAGLRREDLQEGAWLRCTHYLLALEMARAGMGAALVPDFLAKRHIEDRTLAYLDRAQMPSGRTYRLCYKQSRGREAAIRSLVSWLKTELTPAPAIRLGVVQSL